jgi:uncharacterized membrane protein HdeD (DUF308 family)
VTDWYPPLGRAIPALALAVVITFSADHSARLGLTTFGAFAVVSGLATAALLWRSRSTTAGRVQLVQSGLSVVAGVAALALTGGGLPYLVFLLTFWAAVTGVLEFWLGLRRRRVDRAARDWMFAGGLTAVFAVAVLLVPPELSQPVTGAGGFESTLTASIVVVGLLGAYAAILGVFLVIGALSLKWAPAPPAPDVSRTTDPIEASS